MTFVHPSSDLQLHWCDDVIEEEMHWKAIFILTAAGTLFGSISLWVIIQIGISLIMCTILTYTDIAIIGHNTNRVFVWQRVRDFTLQKMKTWKCKKRKYFVQNKSSRQVIVSETPSAFSSMSSFCLTFTIGTTPKADSRLQIFFWNSSVLIIQN